MPLKGRLCNTCLPYGSRVFGDLVPLRQDLIRSGRQGVGGRRRRARQLAAVSHLRAVRSRDSDLDARDVLRLRGVRVLPADPGGRVRLRLAQGRARMAVDRPKSQRLADHGLQSERLLWPGKGPSEFEQELGDIESQLGLTTLDKA